MTETNGSARGGFPSPLNDIASLPAEERQRVIANVERAHSLLANIVASRTQFLSRLLDPRRNIDDECGHPRDPVDPSVYQDLYDRDAVSCRVVEVLPRESWQVTPSVYENENGQVTTGFEVAWQEFLQSLQGEDNFLLDEHGSTFWDTLKKADIESGIGHYGTLLVGFDDGKGMEEAAVYRENQKVLWLQTYPETCARVVELESRKSSPRFGQPVRYEFTFNDPNQLPAGALPYAYPSTTSQVVHWTRVVHLCDGGVTYAPPRMRPVLNRLTDLRKLYGGSAEMYWRGAFPGISFETDPSLGGEVTADTSAIRDSVEQYMNGLQRYLALNGFTAKSLAPQVVDPTPQIDAQITAICIKLGIPKRVFMGSERGELASSQDDAAWNDRLRERQKYVTSRIIAPFVNRLISMGVLPKPKKGYHVWWPDLTSQTDEQKSSVALKLMQSLAQYVSSGGDQMITPFDFFNLVWKLSEKESLNVVDRATKRMEELGASQFAEPEPSEPPPSASPPQNGSGNGNGLRGDKIAQMPQDAPNPSKPANTNRTMEQTKEKK